MTEGTRLGDLPPLLMTEDHTVLDLAQTAYDHRRHAGSGPPPAAPTRSCSGTSAPRGRMCEGATAWTP